MCKRTCPPRGFCWWLLCLLFLLLLLLLTGCCCFITHHDRGCGIDFWARCCWLVKKNSSSSSSRRRDDVAAKKNSKTTTNNKDTSNIVLLEAEGDGRMRGSSWKPQPQQQVQHQQQLHEHNNKDDDDDDDDAQLVLIPVSTCSNNSSSRPYYSIDMLPHLPRGGFLVRVASSSSTALDFFSIILPDDDNDEVSSLSHSLPLLPFFSQLPAPFDFSSSSSSSPNAGKWRTGQKNAENHHQLERTSSQAQRHNCTIAVNAGPFHKDGSCVGTVVVNGKRIIYNNNNNNSGSSSTSPNNSSSSICSRSSRNVGFGITAAGGPVRNWVLGSLAAASDNSDIARLGIVQFVTGFDWLVQDGVNVAIGRNNTTGAERVPRTSIGVDNQGRLVILVTDGCELWYVCTGNA
jgi:Phosphodiester glycosidase